MLSASVNQSVVDGLAGSRGGFGRLGTDGVLLGSAAPIRGAAFIERCNRRALGKKLRGGGDLPGLNLQFARNFDNVYFVHLTTGNGAVAAGEGGGARLWRSPAQQLRACNDLPGINRIFCDRCNSQASATCIGVAPSRLATFESVDDWSGVNPPSGKNGT